MSVSTIGIQMITPKTGVSSKSPPPRTGDREEAVTAVTLEEAVKRKPPPAPPGQGKLIDKSV
jgi:hypothetical protein